MRGKSSVLLAMVIVLLAISSTFGDAPVPKPKWEYAILERDEILDNNPPGGINIWWKFNDKVDQRIPVKASTQEALNVVGGDGWELVNFIQGSDHALYNKAIIYFFLKRQI